MTPRACRNDNPGNLRIGANWQGLRAPYNMTPLQESEREFCVFTAPKWGFRALALLLRHYGEDGMNTVRRIIHRYAPENENDTAAYIRAVCADTGFGPDAPLDLNSPAVLARLCKAIAIHESGGWYFSPHDLESGIAMAVAS